ncbi:helix-turn-helix transcriptional regulator [Paenibacillus albidus]|uniref:helix-turn-helix transcriptional regulator n=1 Tax=Paenibacillus albidus TaxID=2041023 RepID=UPI001BE95A86|nr:helix-turn-helix transcriptional regulator [Paenibacillus albidus]MBT2291283.1 helix-turn-helix transcriptional regulator [Paenibacillus albidus]
MERLSELVNRVRELRARDRLSQQELAQRIGASRQTIALIERGDYSPSVVLALKIAAAFKVQVEDIFSIQEEEREQ